MPERPDANMTRKSFPNLAALGAALAVLAGACVERNAYQAPPPVEVVVAHPVHGAMEDSLEIDGLIAGVQNVEIRAQVEGRVTAIHFKDGQLVEEGDLLFTIDPRTYEAAALGASAEVAKLQAQLAYAEADFERQEQLYEADNIALQEYEQARQRTKALKAQVAAARASASGAAVQLEFARVTAPIAGRMSRRLVDKGQLVGAGEPTLLATLVASAQTYVELSVSQTDLLWARQYLAKQGVTPKKLRENPLVVRVGLPGEDGFPHVGRMESAENALSSSTGTLKMRALFDNPDGTLMPGLFCRTQIVLGASEGLAVPEVALNLDQVGRYVFVVNAKGEVERRDVTLGGRRGDLRRINSGLKAEDRVIVRGMARVRLGSHVKATEQPIDAKLAAPGALAAPTPDAPAVPAAPDAGSGGPGTAEAPTKEAEAPRP